MTKTIIFERKYNVCIDNLRTTGEIDAIIEKAEGRNLRIVKLGHRPQSKDRGMSQDITPL